MQTQWIWLPDAEGPDRYAEFRVEFNLETIPTTAELRIAADTVAAVWINGKFAFAGQFSDYPEEKTFTSVAAAGRLTTGKNVLAIMLHYCGASTLSYIPGSARLWFELEADGEILCRSTAGIPARLSPAYAQGRQIKTTRQLGFSFDCDTRRDDGWREPEYRAAAAWGNAIPAECTTPKPEPRPLPPPELRAPTPFTVAAQGVLLRRGREETETVARLMQSDFLSARSAAEFFPEGGRTVTPEAHSGTDGFYLLVDMGREECGFLHLDVEEAAAGTVIDIAVGQHLADLRVRAALPAANFASRCICRGGRQEFTHCFSRYSGRYVQLHVTRATGNVTLRHAGVIPLEYPVAMRGAFTSPDSLLNRIYEVARRTLHLCIHEHYEDTPWREQALYANDSRNQALTGYYTFGEYDVPRVSFELLGRGFGPDGVQEMCAPTHSRCTIPSFTLMWYLALRDHLLFSGDRETARRRIPVAVEMLGRLRKTMIDGLLPSPAGMRYWHFYDWAPGMDGSEYHPIRNQCLSGRRFDAPLNFLFVMAQRAVAEMMDFCGENAAAEELRESAAAAARAMKSCFLNPERGLFVTFVGEQAPPDHYAELTQALAILAEIPGPEETDRLRALLADPGSGLVATTLSQSIYKFDALLSGGEKFAGKVLQRIRDEWGYMLYRGATTFWETIKGQRDFAYYGSLCHGWSAVPAYIFQRYLLGVEPVEPGFRRFRVAPLLSVMDSAAGRVPTPAGGIEVSWSREGKEYCGTLAVPPGLEAEIPETDGVKWQIRRG